LKHSYCGFEGYFFMKICTKCKIEKYLSDFCKRTLSKDGLSPICRVCNYVKCTKYNKGHYNYIKKIRIYKTAAETVLLKKEYFKKNHELRRRDGRYEKYRDKYYIDNKEKLITNAKAYTNNNLKTDPIYRFKHVIRIRIRLAIKSKSAIPTAKIWEILGAHPFIVKSHIESLFKSGMTWENHGTYGWHIDHKVPLALAKTKEQIIELCHYTNLQPLWAPDNRKKWTNIK
jgi:hypothetical protein